MLSGLEDLRSLTKLNLGNCSSLKEVAVLKELPALRELGIWGCSSLTDLDVLKERSALTVKESLDEPGDEGDPISREAYLDSLKTIQDLLGD